MTTVINTDKIIIEDTVDNNRRGINLTGKRLSKEERERQIQEAAKGIILEKGYENATMDDVIEKSGMSTGGVYHYYKIYEEKLYSDFEKSEVSKRMLGDKFLLFLIHSLILGYETFEPLGSKKVFNENEDFIREVIILYLKKFNDN